jgi:hypothetical protein
VFIPSLAALLTALEQQKGEPLTESEVLAARDGAPVIMLERSRAAEFHKSRGHQDIDPADCWRQWLEFRSASQA